MRKNQMKGNSQLSPADQEAIEAALSQKLKHYYDQMAQQELPQQLTDLLEKLGADPMEKKS